MFPRLLVKGLTMTDEEIKMIERPIIFRGPMVQAILEGRKTETRRVIKVRACLGQSKPLNYSRVPLCMLPPMEGFERMDGADAVFRYQIRADDFSRFTVHCPFSAGMTLWVKETWCPHPRSPRCRVAYRADMSTYPAPGCPHYRLTSPEPMLTKQPFGDQKWKPSIFMPKWACRLWLKVLEVRVERVQEISEEGARAEGCETEIADPREEFTALWKSIHGKKPGMTWDDNPWVWVIHFERTDHD